MRREMRSNEVVGLRELKEGIESWRRTRSRGQGMPERLWREAATFAREHGVYAVARCLRLDYHSLKRRSEASLPVPVEPLGSRPRFVEVPLESGRAASGCAIEVVKADGSRLTIRTEGSADLTGLTRAFMEARR